MAYDSSVICPVCFFVIHEILPLYIDIQPALYGAENERN